MRKSTIASLLILCGSTAALAQVTPSEPQQTANNTTMSNSMIEPMPAPGNETMTPTPPPADNAVMTNEMSPAPKPM